MEEIVEVNAAVIVSKISTAEYDVIDVVLERQVNTQDDAVHGRISVDNGHRRRFDQLNTAEWLKLPRFTESNELCLVGV